MQSRICSLLVGMTFLIAGPAVAERTDEVVLYNGNTITGEVKSLQQGMLRFKTDHAGDIYVEWEFVFGLVSSNLFEVEDQDGRFFYGMLASGNEDRKLMVIGPTESVALDMDRVVEIMPIRQTFWGRVDGSLNLGASLTSADNILQYSVESDATYRVRKFSARMTLNLIENRQEDRETTFRDNIDFTYTRYRKNRYFGAGSIAFSRSSELGIDFRTEIGGVYGRTFVQSNRSRLSGSAGLTVSRETPIGEDPSGSFVSGTLRGQYHFYLYNYPKTDISVGLNILPGITDRSRLRVDFNGALKREIVRDFTVNFSIYDSYDSRPPGGEEAANHDFGVILSVGWTF